jgi:hypothetical protein
MIYGMVSLMTKREILKEQIIKHLKRRSKNRNLWWMIYMKPVADVAEDMINDYWPQLNENNIPKEIQGKQEVAE